MGGLQLASRAPSQQLDRRRHRLFSPWQSRSSRSHARVRRPRPSDRWASAHCSSTGPTPIRDRRSRSAFHTSSPARPSTLSSRPAATRPDPGRRRSHLRCQRRAAPARGAAGAERGRRDVERSAVRGTRQAVATAATTRTPPSSPSARTARSPFYATAPCSATPTTATDMPPLARALAGDAFSGFSTTEVPAQNALTARQSRTTTIYDQRRQNLDRHAA